MLTHFVIQHEKKSHPLMSSSQEENFEDLGSFEANNGRYISFKIPIFP